MINLSIIKNNKIYFMNKKTNALSDILKWISLVYIEKQIKKFLLNIFISIILYFSTIDYLL